MVDADPGADDTTAEAALRAEIRTWMDVHAAPYGRRTTVAPADDSLSHFQATREWQQKLDDGRWAAPTWPARFGGRDFGPNEFRIFREEEDRYAVPTGARQVSVLMVGPTLIAHGTDEQRHRLLGPIRNGSTSFCQLFSEPDAGSDLPSLRTKAIRDGDEWLVTGQKIWTSNAHGSDRGILLARTEPESRRHDGLSFFLIDIEQVGIEVQPIEQINGGRHFSQVFLDGARVRDADRIGAVGEGWKVARTTLGAERAMIGSIRVDDRVDQLIASARASGRLADPVLRDALVDLYIRARALSLTSERVLNALRAGDPIGPEGSVLKLGLSNLFGQMGDLAPSTIGPHGMLAGSDERHSYGAMQNAFLAQWLVRIGGGTEQIQRNTIGERALGLAREVTP